METKKPYNTQKILDTLTKYITDAQRVNSSCPNYPDRMPTEIYGIPLSDIAGALAEVVRERDLMMARFRAATNRLAAYERSGLTSGRAAELGKADAENRLFVVPVPVGEKCYVITRHMPLDCKSCANQHRAFYMCNLDKCDHPYAVREVAVEVYVFDENGLSVPCEYNYGVPEPINQMYQGVGNVFFSLEEARTAFEGKKNDDTKSI